MRIYTQHTHGCWTTKFEPGKRFWFKYIVSERNETSRGYNAKSFVYEVKGFLVKLGNASNISKNKDTFAHSFKECEALSDGTRTIDYCKSHHTCHVQHLSTDIHWYGSSMVTFLVTLLEMHNHQTLIMSKWWMYRCTCQMKFDHACSMKIMSTYIAYQLADVL